MFILLYIEVASVTSQVWEERNLGWKNRLENEGWLPFMGDIFDLFHWD